MWMVVAGIPGAKAFSGEKVGEYGDWEEIKPGGLSTCARGAEFSFFFRPADSDKLVIDFMGGGACWNDTTCKKSTATFTDSVDYVRDAYKKGLEGIYNHSLANNPVKDWNHVVIPYCTGDLHWGNNESTYHRSNGEAFTIMHRGAENVKAVLAWVQNKFLSPQKILMTGCSAGSYASIFWTPKVKEMYMGAEVIQLGDSGAGVLTRDFQTAAFPLWKPELAAPSWIPELDPRTQDWTKLSVPKLYRIVGKFYPEVRLAQYNTIDDSSQIFFYELMGGLAWDWSPNLVKGLDNITRLTTNFSSYVAPGMDHCIIPYKRFYTMKANGVKFRDWFADHLDGNLVSQVK
jgi:hypothetical protein